MNPSATQSHLHLVREARSNGQITRALGHLTRALKLNPQDQELRSELDELVGQIGQVDALAQKLHRHVCTPVHIIQQEPELAVVAHNMPVVVFNALPKSASDYISDALAKGLNLDDYFAVTGVFPNKLLRRDAMANVKAGALLYDHVDAAGFNQILLSQYVDRMIVHVRDPRQALVSWTHHFRQRYENRDEVLAFYQFCPDYYSWSFERQLDWQIEHYFHHFVDWITGWLDADENPGFKPAILFSTFETFRTDPRKYFEGILKFYDIAPERFSFPEVTHPSREHFRQGSMNEWQRVFTNAQIDKTSAMLRGRIAPTFGWDVG